MTSMTFPFLTPARWIAALRESWLGAITEAAISAIAALLLGVSSVDAEVGLLRERGVSLVGPHGS